MNFTAFGAALAGVTLFAASQAQAVTVTFDDFTTAQVAGDAATVGVPVTSVVGFGAGTRTFTVKNTLNGGPIQPQTSLSSSGGTLSFSNADGATGWAEITYTNVGDIDLGPGGYFNFIVGFFDNYANFTATVTDTANNVSTYAEALTPTFNPQLLFSAFTGSADFNSVASVTFRIDTTGGITGVDGSLKGIEIGAVPVPAAGLMLLSGIGGIAALRRRKKLS